MSLLLALAGGGGPANYTVTASSGSYAVSGVAASILKTRIVTAVAGSYAYSGIAANIYRSKRIVSVAGAYTYTGVAANLYRSKRLVAVAGAYTYTGTSANVYRSKLITGLSGAYAYTGVAAGVTYTPVAGAYSITANSGAYTYTGVNATITRTGGSPSFSAEIELRPWYVKRGKKIHLFNSAQEADDYLESLEQAEKAIQEAQKTSRRARQRLRRKIVTVEPIKTVDIDLLSDAVSRFDLPTLPNLIEQQDFARFMQILAIAQEMQEEEDIELLLLA